MTTTSIIHLISNNAFLPFVASVFDEAAPNENQFFVYGSDTLPVLPAGVRAELVDTSAAGVERVGKAVASSRIVIAHSMSTFSALVIAAAPTSTLRVWSGWGGDYSGSALNSSAGLLGRDTARLVRRRGGLIETVQGVYSSLYVDSLLRAAAKASDVFSAPVPTDFPVFRSRFRGFRGEYRQLNYASVEDTYATTPDKSHGNDILLGNSATPENNHLELFRLLAENDLTGRRVLVPLAYGDLAYAEDVACAGVEILGEHFVPIRGFLPLAEYNGMLSSCGTVVMGHRRQQALGNVARAVWQGAHLYLDKRSPVLDFFQQLDLPARTIDDLSVAGLPTVPPSHQEIEATRKIARSIWGREVVIENVRILLSEANI